MRIITVFLTGLFLIAVTDINCDDKLKIIKDEMMKHAQECYKEINLTKEEEEKFKVDNEFAKLKTRCFSACFMKKSDELGENKKANLEKISEIEHALHPKQAEEVIKIISKCLEEVKNVEDECDFANAYDECVHKNTFEIFKHERIP